MQEREIESLFLAYRDRADVESLAQVFDRAAPELQALARHLVREPSEAEDLLQETFLTAIERSSDWQGSRRLMPWLVGILAVASRRRARERSRTPDPSRVISPTPGAPESSASAQEFRGEVERALAALPQQERELLAQYLLDERMPHEIAGELGLAPGTVRMRIQRALESLRRLLPAGVALGGAAMLPSPRSLADVRRIVLEHGQAQVPAVAGAWFGTKAMLALAIGACSLLAGWMVLAKEPAASPGAAASWLAAGPVNESTPPSAPGLEVQSAPAQRTTSKVPESAAPGYWLRVKLEHPDRLEAGPIQVSVATTGAAVSLGFELAAAPELLLDLTPLAAQGDPPRGVTVRFDHPRYMPQVSSVDFPSREIAPGRKEASATVRLLPAVCFAEGTMELDGLEPDVKGLIALVGPDTTSPSGVHVVDQREGVAAGPFRLRAATAGPHTIVASVVGATPVSLEIQLVAGEARNAGRVTLTKGLAIRGRVNLPQDPSGWIASIGADFEGARPALLGDLQSLAWSQGKVVRGSAWTRSATDGSFELVGLSPGNYRINASLSIESAKGTAPLSVGDDVLSSLQLEAKITRTVTCPCADVSIDLPRTAERSFVLRVTSKGTPVRQAEVTRLFGGGGSMGSNTNADGELPVVIATRAHFRMRITKPGFEIRELEFDPAEIVHGSIREVALEPGAAPLAVSFEAGAVKFEGLVAQLVPLESMGELRPKASEITSPGFSKSGSVLAAILADGTLGQPVAPGSYWGRIFPNNWPDNGGATNLLPATFECKIEAGQQNRVRVTLVAGGRIKIDARALSASEPRISVTLSNLAGEKLGAEFKERTISANGVPQSRGTYDAVFSGAVMESTPLAPGEYKVTVTRSGAPAKEHTLKVESGASTTITLEP